MKKVNAILLALTICTLLLGVEVDMYSIIVRPFDIGLLLLIFFLACQQLAGLRPRFFFPVRNMVLACVLVFILYRTLNGFLLGGKFDALKELIQSIEYVLLVFLVGTYTRTNRTRLAFLKTFYLCVGLVAIGTVLWHVAHGQYVGYKMLEDPKYSFGLFALFALCAYMVNRSRVHKWPAIILLGLAVIMLLLSGERKGWIAFIAAALFALLAYRHLLRHSIGTLKKSLVPYFVLGVGVVLIIGFSLSGNTYVDAQMKSFEEIYGRISFDEGVDYKGPSKASDSIRLYLLHFAINSVKAHPFFGIGTGKWHERIRAFAASDGRSGGGAHSEYQRVIVENGLVGLVLYLLCYLLMLRGYLKLARRGVPGSQVCFLWAAGLGAYGATVNAFSGSLSKAFLFLPIGLLLGYLAETRKRPDVQVSQPQQNRVQYA